MGNNSVPEFIFRLSRFPVYRGSVLGRFYCIIHAMLLLMINVLYFYFNTFEVYMHCPVCFLLFLGIVIYGYVFWIFWMMLRWFQLPILLLASLLFSYSTYVVFLYFEIFLASFLITYLTPEIAVSVNRCVHFS